MATYSAQIEMTKAAHMASRAISDASELKIQNLVDDLHTGSISIGTYRRTVKAIVRKAYKDAGRTAKELTKQSSDMPSWEPELEVGDSEYLKSLLADVDRNVTIYENSERTGKDLRNLNLRVQLSAITGAERGFTDSQLNHYGELQDMGYQVRKIWLANFVNNEPCIDCVHLHGTQVDFNQEFPIPTLMKTAVYRDLQGPPLHVRCKCVMAVIITTLENMFEKLEVDSPEAPTTMNTQTVKRLPLKIFNAIIKVLRTITGMKKDD